MTHLHTSLLMLQHELNQNVLQPTLIANGYYTEVTNALGDLEQRVAGVHELVAALRVVHYEQHQPGPLDLCDPICRMVDAL